MSNTDQVKQFRYIHEGQGGTFNFIGGKHATDSIPLIGTWRCLTCVGVYLQIDSRRCFVAHINALVRRSEGGVDRACSEEGGETLKQEVLKAFRDHAAENQWPPHAPALKHLVCPKPTADLTELNALEQPLSSTIQAGHYVIQAIKDFLDDQSISVSTEYEGFIHDRQTGTSHMIRFEPYSDSPSDASGYEAVPQPDGDDFTFTVEVSQDHDGPELEQGKVRRGSTRDQALHGRK